MLQRDLVPFNPDDWIVVWNGGDGLTCVGAQRAGAIYERMEGDVNEWLADRAAGVKTVHILVDERAAVLSMRPGGSPVHNLREFGSGNSHVGSVRAIAPIYPEGAPTRSSLGRAPRTDGADET